MSKNTLEAKINFDAAKDQITRCVGLGYGEGRVPNELKMSLKSLASGLSILASELSDLHVQLDQIQSDLKKPGR